jgi:hypothetical protein
VPGVNHASALADRNFRKQAIAYLECMAVNPEQ